MRLIVCASILLAGCADADKAPVESGPIEIVGYLQYKSLDEASGLAFSRRRDGLLWAINDDGPADLFAIDTTGAKVGKVRVAKAGNSDWEDLASFELDGVAYLLIADIGDNQQRRKDVRVYVVEEPDPDRDKVDIAWQFDFSYPDGSRDAESIAVDTRERKILVLSKRDSPARLYSLPLVPETDDGVVADYLGTVTSLPQPSRRDINSARFGNNWFWEPAAMDIAADGTALLIQTPGGVYYFARGEDTEWHEALQQRPLGLKLRGLPDAESIAFEPGGEGAYVTVEKKNAPLLRIDLAGARNR